jgi:predicted DNA-binding transcriptional regulator YafY
MAQRLQMRNNLVPSGPVEPQASDEQEIHGESLLLRCVQIAGRAGRTVVIVTTLGPANPSGLLTVEELPDDQLPVNRPLSYAHGVASHVSPTARALQTLEILRSQPGTTADQIAERLEVTGRAARRYVAILREAGVPVESSRGRYGGYRLGLGVRLPPVVFTQDEALGLVMAVLEGHPAATGTGELAGSALAKVIRALPENVGRQAAALREYASAAPDRQAAHPDHAVTSALVVAVASKRRVRLQYQSQSGNEWGAEVDPWAVVVRHGHWYLLCHSHHARAVRSYRIDRVRMVEHTRHSFTPPDGLDPVAALEENLGEGWDFPASRAAMNSAPRSQHSRRDVRPRSRMPLTPTDRADSRRRAAGL